MNAADTEAARTAAVAATVERIRAIERAQGVTRPALDAIKAEMLKLAAQEHLFPTAAFPPPPPGEKGSRRYMLQRGRRRPVRDLPERAQPRQRDQAARPHHLGRGGRGRGPGTEQGLSPHRRRQPRRCGRLVLDHEVMVEPGTRHRADARGHPLDPYRRRGADAASAHVRPRHGEARRSPGLRSRNRHREAVQCQLHAPGRAPAGR